MAESGVARQESFKEFKKAAAFQKVAGTKVYTNLSEKQQEVIEDLFHQDKFTSRCFFGTDDYDADTGEFTGSKSLLMGPRKLGQKTQHGKHENEKGGEDADADAPMQMHSAMFGKKSLRVGAEQNPHARKSTTSSEWYKKASSNEEDGMKKHLPQASSPGHGESEHGHGESKHAHGSKGHGNHGHGEHHLSEPSLVTALAAGLINYLLMFGFCCAYGLIMFNEDGNHRHCALGMRMSLACAMTMGLLLTSFSKMSIAMGGPDMNSVIFVGTFVKVISKELIKQLHLDDLYGDDELSKYFCVGDHYLLHAVACDDYHAQLRATVLFTVSVSSLLVAVVFALLGIFKFTVYVSYVPTSIVDAFLSCMGYKVFKYALKICKHDPGIFLPAAFIGVPAYFFKAMHIGPPLVILPTLLILPVVIAYCQILIQDGGDLYQARKDKILFTEVEHEPFWTIWSDGVFNTDKINFKAFGATVYEILTMVIVLVLDCLVTAVRTTETKIPVKVSKNYETGLYGLGNLLATLFGGVPGYMQLKFNVINFGIMANTSDRRSGIIFSFLCAVTFFVSGWGFNYVPRVFVGTLLFFGGSGFVAEHLWGSKDYLSYSEWGQVFLILVIFILTDEIVWAVAIGSMLCGLTFIAKYANIPCITGLPLRGGEVHSHEQYPPMVLRCLMHVSNSWLLVIRLKGFVFFASVQSVTQHIRNLMLEEDEVDLPVYRRVKFVLLDCQLLDGLDSSAEKDLQMITRDASWHGMRILWSSLDPELAQGMLDRGTIADEEDVFADMDDALLYLDGLCIGYRKKQQDLWDQLHPAFALFKQLTSWRESFEPWGNILRLDADRFGCPWDFVGTMKIMKCRSLLWSPGQTDRELFLVHSGAVGIFRTIPDRKGQGDFGKPIAVFRHGWFVNREFLLQSPTRYYAVALEDGEVVYWTRHEWWRMHREQPFMANSILEAAMRQATCEREGIQSELNSASTTVTANDVEEIDHLLREGSIGETVMGSDNQQLPEDLEARIEGMMNAQALQRFRLYDPIPPDEVGVLPEMPPPIRRDLEVAFQVYKVNIVNDEGKPCDCNCGFLTTWHESHCCEKCQKTMGQEHDAKCQKILDQVSAARAIDREGFSTLQACPCKCGFLLTWHDTHCCSLCKGSRGQLHGVTCDNKLDENAPSTVRSCSCGFVAKWPESFCCEQCCDTSGKEHGPLCTKIRPEIQTPARIPWKKVREALMYAGIFNTLLNANGPDLSEADFIQIGHEAIFHRFSNFQIARIYNVFKYAVASAGGEIPRDDLHAVLTTSFLPGISEQEVNGIAEIWDTDASDSVDAGEFIGVVSRLARRHEIDWNLLRGCRDVLLKASRMDVSPIDCVTKRKLLLRGKVEYPHAWSRRELTEEDATEMLWCNACYGKLIVATQQGEMLDFAGLVGALIFDAPRASGKLPPVPSKVKTSGKRSFSQFRELVAHSDAEHNPHLQQFKKRMTTICQANAEQAVIPHWTDAAEASEAADVSPVLRNTASEDSFWNDSKMPSKVSNGSESGAKVVSSPASVKSSESKRASRVSFGAVSFAGDDLDGGGPLTTFKGKVKKKRIFKKPNKSDLGSASESLEMQPLIPTERMPADYQALPATKDMGLAQSNAMVRLRSDRLRSVSEGKAALPQVSNVTSDGRPRLMAADMPRPAGFGKRLASKPTNSYDPKAEKNLEVFRRAKTKLGMNFKEIHAKLMEFSCYIALEQCGMSQVKFRVTDLVIDLRSQVSARAVPNIFLKTRLERLSFSQERQQTQSDKQPNADFGLGKWTSAERPEVKIHLLMDHPESSRTAAIFSMIMGAVIVLSVGTMFAKNLAHPHQSKELAAEERSYWRVAEASFTIIFLSELMVRFAVCDALGTMTRVQFLLKPLNVCDFLSCCPFLLEMVFARSTDSGHLGFLRVARLLRLSRLLRIARLGMREGASNTSSNIFGPTAVILTIIWGIYLKEKPADEY